jgi:hypothetical protein
VQAQLWCRVGTELRLCIYSSCYDSNFRKWDFLYSNYILRRRETNVDFELVFRLRLLFEIVLTVY